MVFNSVLVFYFTADCPLGETHRRYQTNYQRTKLRCIIGAQPLAQIC
jgi:hypothetical protein